MMTPDEILESDIEMALAKYLGSDYPLPTEEWSNIAILFAAAVRATQVTPDITQEPYEFDTAARAKDLVATLGQLLEVMSEVVE